ncbi:MAG: bifunctional methylenetetrahydrofolate dehydrogenase/methenyltetrahydrofolate cyclohydrolase FolD, partial [Erysipelotrichaceae bacterium]|nr:bifunctional methylenetetrahydrofolate dehydrogenase/methenyltetrahydrofolate cyclohydrolase FolD [Erysipelotrichaceae bacterium]
KHDRLPCLCVILVGDDPASISYVKGKEKACEQIGFASKMISLPKEILEEELLQIVKECNEDDSIDGILVQLPLPKHINAQNIIANIDPAKDVDGLHPVNVAKLYQSQDGFVPCTPQGVMQILKEAKVTLAGKHVVVVGRSHLVGSPVARLLLNENATVTICHSYTNDLATICASADILVVCVGKARMITSEYVKEGAVVIDVGVNRDDNGKLCGDVDFEQVKDKCSLITPVPKGVGPMTICMLLANTLKAYKERVKNV